MKNSINLKVTNPCQENFGDFKKTAKGGFCGSCQKEVVDFTKMNSSEIVEYVASHSAKDTCGRFMGSQLKTYTYEHPKSKMLGFLAGLSFAFLSFFGLTNVNAQENKKAPDNRGNNPSAIDKKQQEKELMVSGKVMDESGPLPGASIMVKGTTKGVQTDFDGNFSFEYPLKKGDELVISYIGYKTQIIKLNDENASSTIRLKVNMDEMHDVIILGELAVQKVYKSKN